MTNLYHEIQEELRKLIFETFFFFNFYVCGGAPGQTLGENLGNKSQTRRLFKLLALACTAVVLQVILFLVGRMVVVNLSKWWGKTGLRTNSNFFGLTWRSQGVGGLT